MKKLLISAVVITTLMSSCKKEDTPQPQVVTKIIHDTVPPTKEVHDTVYISTTPVPLFGEWKLWKLVNYIGGVPDAPDYHNDYIFNFGTTTVIEVLGSTGTYTYPITYYTGYVDIKISASITDTYIVENINKGQEYKLTKFNGAIKVRDWYFKK